jgi:hypothetical protein
LIINLNNSFKKCGINGCKFRAAAKLVEIHFKNVTK